MRTTHALRRSARAALLALLLAAPVAPALAGPHGGRGWHHGPPPGALLDHHADELGLDEATRDAIREIVESSHEEGRALREEIRQESRALHDLMTAEDVDRDAVIDQVERIGALRTEADKHRIESMLAIRAQLSPEQRAALVELRSGMKDHFMGPILDACEEDLAGRCEEGGPRAVHCLFRQRDELSEGCTGALEEMRGRFHERGFRRSRFQDDEPPPMKPLE